VNAILIPFLYRYAEEFEQDEDQYSWQPAYPAYNNRGIAVAEVGLAYPLHHMEIIQKEQQDKAKDRIDDERQEIFYQKIRDGENHDNEDGIKEKVAHDYLPEGYAAY
jgi:hypothetical protein